MIQQNFQIDNFKKEKIKKKNFKKNNKKNKYQSEFISNHQKDIDC